MHKHTHAHRKSGYLYILAFVYLSAVPACGVTYSRVQNESELGELEAVFSLQLRLVWLCSALLLLQLPADWHPTTTGTHPCTTVAVELVRPPETQPSQIKHGNSLSTFALYFFLTVCLTKFPSSYSAALQRLFSFVHLQWWKRCSDPEFHATVIAAKTIIGKMYCCNDNQNFLENHEC